MRIQLLIFLSLLFFGRVHAQYSLPFVDNKSIFPSSLGKALTSKNNVPKMDVDQSFIPTQETDIIAVPSTGKQMIPKPALNHPILHHDFGLPPLLENRGSGDIWLAFQGGYSYRFIKEEESKVIDFLGQIKKRRSGYHLRAEGGYYVTENIGLGMKGSRFYTKSKSRNISIGSFIYLNDGFMDYEENISIYYVGPFISARIYDRKKRNALYLQLGLGYIKYLNKLVLEERQNVSSNTLGVDLSFGYDWKITNHFAIGAQLALISGKLSKLRISNKKDYKAVLDFEKDEREGLTRIDLGLRISYLL